MKGYWFEFEGEWYEILDAATPDGGKVYVHCRRLDMTFHVMWVGVGEKIYTLDERINLEQVRDRERWIEQSRQAAPVSPRLEEAPPAISH